MDKYNERKNVILNSAIKHFIRFHDINIRDIAKETNEHIPTIYKFFESKENLIARVVEVMYNDITNSLYKNLDDHDDPFLKITQLGVNYINLAADNHELFQMVLNYTNETLNVSRYSLLLQKAIETLKFLIQKLYEEDRSIFPYHADAIDEEHTFNIDILSNIAWSTVDGLARIYANKEKILNVYENFDQVIIETFIRTNIISQKFREENQDLLYQALEIILTIGHSPKLD